MAQQAVVASVTARLSSLWTQCPIADDNNSGATPPATPFLSVQFPVANEEQISIGSPGSNVFRETGAIRLVLTISPGSGIDWALGWMDQLRAMFRAQQFAGVSTWAPSSPVIDNSNTDGGFWQLSISVPYYFDFLA